MVVRVAERAAASGAERVIVATDDTRVEQAVRQHGVDVMLTDAAHPTGTDRLAEVARRLALQPQAIVVNVQGDEPLIDPRLIRAVAEDLAAHPDAAIATACHRIQDWGALGNPNFVKVVLDAAGYAAYFSRAPIPYPRDAAAGLRDSAEPFPTTLSAFRHVGLYAYRSAFLAAYANLAPAPAEQSEALEQLRALWHGFRIHVVEHSEPPAPGVDTAQDLDLVRKLFDQTNDSR